MSLLRRPLLRALALAFALAPVASLAQTAPPSKTANWWLPAESGWGMFTVDQGNVLAASWFTYDDDGEPSWFFIPNAIPQADGSYAGPLLKFNGVPFAQIVGNASDPAQTMGQATLRFNSDKSMQFAYVIGNRTQTKTLERMNFNGNDLVCRASSGPRVNATNYSDVWSNSSSLGWGVHVTHLDTTLHASWFTYDPDREAVFMIAATTRQADGSYTGPLYRQRNGTPYYQINGGRATSGNDIVGSVTMRFSDGENATFTYTVGNVTQTKTLRRSQVGGATNICAVEPYVASGGGGGGGGGGNGQEECFPPYRIGDTRQLRDNATSNGQPSTYTFRETVVRDATFNGQTGFMQEVDGQTSAGTGVYARNYVGNGNNTTASFGAEALNPTTGQVISTSLNVPARVELARSFTVGQTIPLDFKVNGTSQGFSTTIDIKATYKLIGRESVTVPAGTFNACKFETTTEQTSSVSGISTRTQLAGTSWTSSVFGLLKRQDSGNTTVSGFGINTTTQQSSTQELLSATMNGQTTP
jgi:hypothetical protein